MSKKTPFKNVCLVVCRTYKYVHNVNNEQLLLNHIGQIFKTPNFPREDVQLSKGLSLPPPQRCPEPLPRGCWRPCKAKPSPGNWGWVCQAGTLPPQHRDGSRKHQEAQLNVATDYPKSLMRQIPRLAQLS